MPVKEKTRYAKHWNRLRNINLRDYEDDFQPRLVKRGRGGFSKAKERTPAASRKK